MCSKRMPFLRSDIPVHFGHRFNWTGNHGVSFESDLSLDNAFGVFGRIFTDAADLGFFIVSHKTGKKVLFTVERNVYNGNEIVGVELVSYHRGQFSSKDEIRVTVWNT